MLYLSSFWQSLQSLHGYIKEFHIESKKLHSKKICWNWKRKQNPMLYLSSFWQSLQVSFSSRVSWRPCAGRCWAWWWRRRARRPSGRPAAWPRCPCCTGSSAGRTPPSAARSSAPRRAAGSRSGTCAGPRPPACPTGLSLAKTFWKKKKNVWKQKLKKKKSLKTNVST